MTQKAVEMILMRQLASYLATPIFVVDPEGTLVYYNEAAEAVLGKRFEETGEMPAAEWTQAFRPLDADGRLIEPGALPLSIALREHRPAFATFRIVGLDGAARSIDVTAVPLVGQAGRYLGAVAFFRERQDGA